MISLFEVIDKDPNVWRVMVEVAFLIIIIGVWYKYVNR